MNLLSSKDLNAKQMRDLFLRADKLQPISERLEPMSTELRGKTICNLFIDNSTRTRLSFELAAKRLGAEVLTFVPGASSISKGESLRDTVQNIEALGVDAFVVRHPDDGAPKAITHWTALPVINAADGNNEHPTQALLDCYSIREVVKTDDFSDVHVAIVGDIKHSRPAHSDTIAMTALGAKVTLVGPTELLPESPAWKNDQVTLTDDIGAINDADFVYMLRMQHERHGNSFDTGSYINAYGMTAERLKSLKPDVLIAHHGPMNRGIEISEDVADQFQEFITRHVTNGVTTRMAVLSMLLEES